MLSRRAWTRPVDVSHAGRLASWVPRVARGLRPILRLAFRSQLSGLTNLPRDGAFVLVANHSAGLGLAEIACFAVEYLAATTSATRRPLAAFALPTDFFVPGMRELVRALGAVPSTWSAGVDVLARGVPLLVFPGGDHEALRPLWQAHRVDFGGRTGFVRLAHEARVPIVPLGIAGSHLTAPIFARSRALATVCVIPRLLGAKRWALSLLGIVGACLLWAFIPWSTAALALLTYLWLSSPLVFLPVIPATIRMHIGAPLAVDVLFPDHPLAENERARETPREVAPGLAPDLAPDLARARDLAEHAVQRAVDEARHALPP